MPATANIGYQNATDIVIDMATAVPAATTETFAVTATRAFKVVGISCIAEATAAGSSVEVRKGATVIVTGLAMVTANAVTRAATLVTTALDFAVGDTLNVAVTSGAGVTAQGVIIVLTEPLALGDAKVVTAT
jgi:hypothetical protein